MEDRTVCHAELDLPLQQPICYTALRDLLLEEAPF